MELMAIVAAFCGVLFIIGLFGDSYDRRDARKRAKDGPRWR